MDFKKAADHFRKETTPLAVSQIVIISDQGDFAGSGKLRRNGDQIELEVTLKGNKELPMIGGIIPPEQFWKIGGIIENQAPFWGGSVPHAHKTQEMPFVVHGGHFSFDRIHHLPLGSGSLREAVMEATLEREPCTAPARGYVDAHLTNYNVVWREEMTVTVEQNPFLGDSSHTERNILRGQVGEYEYGLVQRDADCDIHLRLKNAVTEPVGEIIHVSQAFYRALALCMGAIPGHNGNASMVPLEEFRNMRLHRVFFRTTSTRLSPRPLVQTVLIPRC